MIKQPDFHMYSSNEVTVFVSHNKRHITVNLKVPVNGRILRAMPHYLTNKLNCKGYGFKIIPFKVK